MFSCQSVSTVDACLLFPVFLLFSVSWFTYVCFIIYSYLCGLYILPLYRHLCLKPTIAVICGMIFFAWVVYLFSDESKFCISFGNQGPRVWRKSGEAHSPSCLKSSVKFPQSVMIWGAMSSAGVGPLGFLKTNVTAPVY